MYIVKTFSRRMYFIYLESEKCMDNLYKQDLNPPGWKGRRVHKNNMAGFCFFFF